jgi:hypothetical protein
MTIHRGAVCGEIRMHGSGVAVAGAIPSPTISVLLIACFFGFSSAC